MNMTLDEQDVTKIVDCLRAQDDNGLVVLADVLQKEMKTLKAIRRKGESLQTFIQEIQIDETRTTFRFAKGFRRAWKEFLAEFC